MIREIKPCEDKRRSLFAFTWKLTSVFKSFFEIIICDRQRLLVLLSRFCLHMVLSFCPPYLLIMKLCPNYIIILIPVLIVMVTQLSCIQNLNEQNVTRRNTFRPHISIIYAFLSVCAFWLNNKIKNDKQSQTRSSAGS